MGSSYQSGKVRALQNNLILSQCRLYRDIYQATKDKIFYKSSKNNNFAILLNNFINEVFYLILKRNISVEITQF